MEQSYLFILTMMIIPTHVRENLSPMGYAIPIRGAVAGRRRWRLCEAQLLIKRLLPEEKARSFSMERIPKTHPNFACLYSLAKGKSPLCAQRTWLAASPY